MEGVDRVNEAAEARGIRTPIQGHCLVVLW